MTAAIGFDESGPMSGIGRLDHHVSQRKFAADRAEGRRRGRFHDLYCLCSRPGVGVLWAVNREDLNMGSALAVAANELLANLVTR